MIWCLLAALAAPPDVPAEAVPTQIAPDRSAPPAVRAAQLRDLPSLQWQDLSPGVRLAILPIPGVRQAHVRVVLQRGKVDLPTTSAPVIRALHEMWGLATDALDPEAMERVTEGLEADLRAGLGSHSASVEVTAPLEQFPEAMDLVDAVLHTPRFSPREVKRWRWEEQSWWANSVTTEPSELIYATTNQAWWSPDHPYRRVAALHLLEEVKPAALQEAHRQLLRSAPVDVLVVGDVDPAVITPRIRALVDGLGHAGDPSSRPSLAPPSASAILAVDLPGSQTTVSLRMAAPSREHPDHLGFALVDHALGGTFLSRLNSNLREERGLTYGLYSAYGHTSEVGWWGTQVTVKNEDAVEAITQIRHELDTISTAGVTARERTGMARERTSGWNETLGTTPDAVARYGDLLHLPTDIGGLADEVRAIAGLDLEETKTIAQRWLHPDRPQLWVIVGDHDMLSAPLDSLGLPVTWLKPEEVLEGLSDDPLPREVSP